MEPQPVLLSAKGGFDGERWAIAGDTQCPFHFPPAVAVAADVIRSFAPHHVVFNGDMTDFWRISRHAKRNTELRRKLTLQDEIDISITVQDRLRGSFPTIMVDGNHEEMWDRFLGVGPSSELGSLRSLGIEEVMGLRKRGFTAYLPYREGVSPTRSLFVYHGTCVLTTPGQSVQAEVRKLGKSVIMNHVHRRAHVRYQVGPHDLLGIENGCLCQFNPSYAGQTNWSHAITLVTVRDENHYTAEVVDLVSDTDNNELFAWFNGVKFSAPLDYTDGLAIPWRAAQGESYLQSA